MSLFPLDHTRCNLVIDYTCDQNGERSLALYCGKPAQWEHSTEGTRICWDCYHDHDYRDRLRYRSLELDEMKRIPKLARFRADPEKIRVCVRPAGAEWLIRVHCLEDDTYYINLKFRDPQVGVITALQEAKRIYDLKGIDLDMSWAYDHPYYEGGDEYDR